MMYRRRRRRRRWYRRMEGRAAVAELAEHQARDRVTDRLERK
jgi:hypothetical protein